MYLKTGIKKYFADKTNIAVFTILFLITVYAFLVRFINLGQLAYWGDDGQTFLGTLGVMQHGVPRLPSGNILYHTFFSSYLRIIPSYIFGLNEFALRFPSALLGVFTVPLIFLFIRDLVNKYAGLLAAIIASFSIWQIEYSREIRYYQEFQFFYLLSVYFFYRGFFKDERASKYLSVFFILVTTLINNLGFTLIFLFIPLLIYKRFKKFFRKDTLLALFVVVAIIIGQVIHRELFWHAGLSFYNTNVAAGISNPLLRILSKYFAPYVPFYSRIFMILFPTMSYLVFYGWPLVVMYIFIPKLRSVDEDFINIFSKKNYSIKLPFNIFFLYFIFFSNTVFNGFGFQSTQQRYIYHMHPFFIAIFCYYVTDIARLISKGAKIIAGKPRLSWWAKKQRQACLKNIVYFSAIIIIFIFTANWINPLSNFNIISRENGDTVDGRFSVSNTFDFHHDPKTGGSYIYNHKDDNDIVIATDLLNPFGYTRQIDYWLWTCKTFNTWQPFVYKETGVYEEFFGIPVIRDYYQFLKVLNENSNKDIWLITSNSITVPAHISEDIAEFISMQTDHRVITGKDRICSVYLFEKTDKPTRGFGLKVGDGCVIKIPKTIGPDKPQKLFPFSFSNKKNQQYLFYGWSTMEQQGTWTDKNHAVLFFDFPEKRDYEMVLEVMSMYSSKKPQEMKLLLNGEQVGHIRFKDNQIGQHSFLIEKDLIKTGSYNILEIQSKYILTPSALGLSIDTRNLAVFFRKITIYPI